MPSKLTEREKWLMKKAYSEGHNDEFCNNNITLKDWLASAATHAGHTVEYMLAHDAPETKGEGDDVKDLRLPVSAE